MYVIIVTILIVLFVKRDNIKALLNENIDSNEIDYSFGLKEAKSIRGKIIKEKYTEAEDIIDNLNSDELVVVLDYVGLSVKESFLLKWLKKGKSDYANLFLGVYYNHQGWIVRTHGYAKDVSREQQLGFMDYQKKSRDKLYLVKDVKLQVEAFSRLIRVSTGDGDIEKAKEYFNKVISYDDEILWAYIHYSEGIQPKWGGDLTLISDLMENLPNRAIIRQVTELKLIVDSFISVENYFGGSMDELIIRANERLLKIDKEISAQPLKSIQKYVLYNYMMALSEQIGNTHLEKKYFKKMNGYYTLYPYGIIK